MRRRNASRDEGQAGSYARQQAAKGGGAAAAASAAARSRETYLDVQLQPKKEKHRDVVNHKHVKNDRDRLAYSHKPRAVDFKPGTIKEYLRKNPVKEYKPHEKVPGLQSLGKLPPDLQTEELLLKQANQRRVKEFAKNLSEHNRSMLKRSTAEPRRAAREPSAREKALQFAKQVPKPKVRPPPPQQQPVLVERNGPRAAEEQAKAGARTEMSEIEQLLIAREAARGDVDAIAREFSAQGLG